MTAIITLGPLVVLLGIMVAVTWPDVEVTLMLAVLGTLAVLLPFWTYARSYLMWQALDVVMRPPTPDDFDIVADVTP